MPAFGFDADGVRRIRAMLRWFENTTRNKVVAPEGLDRTCAFRWARATATIPAAVGIKIYSGPIEFLAPDDADDLQPIGQEAEGWNDILGEIDEGNILKVGWVAGRWAIFTARCEA